MKDGGPAFPVPDTHHPDGQIQYGTNGMSLRAWYAGKALVGVLASCGPLKPDPKLSQSDLDNMVAESCVRIADAMLRALERGREGERNDAEDDEAWLARQSKGCIHTAGDGMSWASCEAGERIVAAGGFSRHGAIRALRAKVEGGGQ